MKFRILFSAAVLLSMMFTFTSCDTDPETIEIQDLTTYDDQYFENLRAFKASDHEISFCYYAAWAPLEGQLGYKDSPSWGERFLGLPDSLDIVNLWMGIPTPETHPIAYEDMVYCQKVKGTKFVFHGDASNYNHYFYDRVWNEETQQFEYVLDENGDTVVLKSNPNDEYSIRSYARWVVDTVVKCGLDGVDFDYEGWSNSPMMIVAEECNKFFGPDGPWPEKLFIVDYFSGSPSTAIDTYCDFIVRQAYTWQVGFQTGSSGHDYKKFVLCDSFGAEAGTSGVTGAMIREYAAWEPSSGRKGGCGAFYIDYNYNSPNGTYYEFRQAIQIMNPPLNK